MLKSTIAVLASALGNDPRAVPTIARTLGFTGLQFDIFSPTLNLADLSSTGRREFLRLLSAQNQPLVSLRAAIGTRGLGHGADIDRLLAQSRRALETTKHLNCGVLCLDLGALPAAPQETKPKPRVTSAMAGVILLPETKSEPEPSTPQENIDLDAISRCDSALTELGKLADQIGVVIAMRSDLSPFSALDRALTAVRCPWFGVDLDPVAMLADEWPTDEIFSRLGEQIRHLRARDAVKGQAGRTQPAAIGKGNVNWEELLERLDEAGYARPITVDSTDLPDRVAGAKAGLSALQKINR